MPRVLHRVLKKRPRAYRRKLKKLQWQRNNSEWQETCPPIHILACEQTDGSSSDKISISSTENSVSSKFMDVEYLDESFAETWQTPEDGNNVSNGIGFIHFVYVLFYVDCR